MSSVFLAPLHRLFNHHGLRKLLLRIRAPIVISVVAVWPWWTDDRYLLAGTAIALLGEVWQLWCFGCVEKDRVLTIRGPYQLCRNPMYLGRYPVIGGFVLLSGSWVALCAVTVLYGFYMYNRVKREEQVLERIFGTPYRAYCRDVKRFLPGVSRLDREFWFFSWQILLGNNGHLNLLFTVAVFAYVFCTYQFVLN